MNSNVRFTRSKSQSTRMATTLARKQRNQQLSTQSELSTMKRQAENQEVEQQVSKKRRTAFGDITNKTKNEPEGKKAKKQQKKATRRSTRTIVVPKISEPGPTNSQQEKDMSWEVIELSQSQGSNNSCSSSHTSNNSSMSSDVDSLNLKNLQLSQSPKTEEPPQEWVDVDIENLSDPNQVAVYASHIFSYYKEREEKFLIPDYMPTQEDLTANMRAILVDWLVEVQENFELNHETLYLAVKMVDHFLLHHQMQRERLQLVGATALFIACKFDERCPPVLDDFLYICDDAYQRNELLEMERTVLRTLDFDIGLPLSYRFLRRYAKCCKATMETLTLARFILEMSLMEYNFVTKRDSEMGAAALLLAFRMKSDNQTWDATLVHYSGYTEEELLPLTNSLNTMIARKPHRHLTTITSKYSHRVFYEVAKIKPLKVEQEGDDLIIGD